MNSYFPFITKSELAEKKESIPIYKEVAWDFESNKMVIKNGMPVIVEGNEAIKVWIYKAIKTERYKYLIYSWDYGCELEGLIGKGLPNSLIKAEVKRYIEEALLINPYILSIDDMEVDLIDSILSIKCNINTVYGEFDLDSDEMNLFSF